MSDQLELCFCEQITEHHFPTATRQEENEPRFHTGDYATINGLGSWGYYLFERCYVHEVLADGYRVEICEGLVWGKPWCKDGTILEVPFSALGGYDARTHYRIGAHWVPTVEQMMNYRWEYETNSVLI